MPDIRPSCAAYHFNTIVNGGIGGGVAKGFHASLMEVGGSSYA